MFDNVMFPAPPSSVYTSLQLSANWQTSGAFTLKFQGVNDLNYPVETSTNLTNSTSVLANAFLTDADAGLFVFTDINATTQAVLSGQSIKTSYQEIENEFGRASQRKSAASQRGKSIQANQHHPDPQS
jgi:hypothetical protein